MKRLLIDVWDVTITVSLIVGLIAAGVFIGLYAFLWISTLGRY